MSEEQFKKLDIKCSALKTRVKKRREQMFMNQDKEQFSKQFKLLCEIITNHLDGDSRNDVMDVLTQQKNSNTTKAQLRQTMKDYMQ